MGLLQERIDTMIYDHERYLEEYYSGEIDTDKTHAMGLELSQHLIKAIQEIQKEIICLKTHIGIQASDKDALTEQNSINS